MASRRPGLLPASNLEKPVADVIEPVLDLLSRITSSTNMHSKLPYLPAGASLNDLIAGYNAIVKRIQED
jgi:hypothetical protein